MQLTKHKVYIFYEEDCLLSYVDKDTNKYYLAVWVDDNLYLLSRVSRADLNKVESDRKFDTRYLFVNSSNSFLYNIVTNKIEKKFIIGEIPDYYLPLPDE